MADISFIHSFSECKTIWHQLSILEQEQLLQLSSRIWNGSEVILDEDIPDLSLQGLQQKKIIIQEKGKWQFNLPPMLFFTQSLDLINELTLDVQTANELLHKLLVFSPKRGERPFHEHQELGAFVITQLINQFGRVDLLELVVSDATSDQQFSKVYDYFYRAIPVIEVSVNEFSLFLKGLARRGRTDFSLSILQLGQFRPEFTLQLVDQVVADEEQGATIFLEGLMTGVARSTDEYLATIISKCEAWLGSDVENLCRAALYCLQNLALERKYGSSQFLVRANSLITSPMKGIRYALSIAVTRLGVNFVEHRDECFNTLNQLKSIGPADEIVDGIASGLSGMHREPDFTSNCLSLIVDIPITHKETIKKVNWILYLIGHSDPQLVWEYLEKWILAHELLESVVDYNVFLLTIEDAYKNNPDLARSVVTRWFASSDQRLVEEARSIIRELKIHSFAAEEVNAMSPEKVVYITEKLLVGHFDSTQIIWLCYSILLNTNDFEKLQDYFLRVLRYLAWNYPGGMTKFLDQAISNGGNSEITNLLQNIRQEAERYHGQLRAVKDLFVAELAPSQYRLRKYWEFESKEMQRITEATRDDDRFLFQKFLSRVAVGRGNRSFFMNVLHPDSSQRRTFSEPQGFAHISHSVELPKAEVLDPEGEAWGRRWRQNLQPDDIQLREN